MEVSLGDKVRITQNRKSPNGKQLFNGNDFTVKRFLDDGSVDLRRGRASAVIGKDFGHVDYGYYSTSHSSLGKTAEKVIIAQSSVSGKAASAEQFYVSASRGKFEISIHTDDRESLNNSIERSSKRDSASELSFEQKKERARAATLKRMKSIIDRQRKNFAMAATKLVSRAGR